MNLDVALEALTSAVGGVGALAHSLAVSRETVSRWRSGAVAMSPESRARAAMLARSHGLEWPDAPVACPTCGHRLEE